MPLAKLTFPLLSLPRPAKRAVALSVDASLIVFTVWVAFYLRLDEWARLSGDEPFKPYWAVLTSMSIALPLFVTQGFCRVIFRYSGVAAMQMVLRVERVRTALWSLVAGKAWATGQSHITPRASAATLKRY